MKIFYVIIFLISCNVAIGQNITGILLNAQSNEPVEYANVGIWGKNVGTVTDLNGRFNLFVDSIYRNDTILVSIIGYSPLRVKIIDLQKDIEIKLFLEEKTYEIGEVLVKPTVFNEQTLGVTTKSKRVAAGFKDNLLGYECGILMKVKKTAFLKKVNINIMNCSYDTLFYRLNIYKVNGKNDFENILKEPIYIEMAKDFVKDEIQIDLQSKNIVVEGNFLVTLEHVKNLGDGYLYFCAGLANKTYYRKTSQGKWETAAVGISISVIADVEK